MNSKKNKGKKRGPKGRRLDYETSVFSIRHKKSIIDRLRENIPKKTLQQKAQKFLDDLDNEIDKE